MSNIKSLEVIKQNVFQKENKLHIGYTLRNLSLQVLWLCINNNRNNSPGHETIFDKKNQRLEIKVGNYRVPPGIFIEDPIYAKFIKLQPGEEKKIKLEINLPIQDFNPIDGPTNEYYKIEDLKEISLSVDYYDIDLQKENKCCIVENSDTVLVNCFWAENNLEKRIYQKIYSKRKNQ